MKLISCKNPKYNSDGTIDCIVKFNNGLPEGPYTADPKDPASHGRKLFNELKSGKYGEVALHTGEDAAREKQCLAANKKSHLINEANETIKLLSDEREAGISSDDDMACWKAWVKYRKALRELDVTSTDIEWPTKPE